PPPRAVPPSASPPRSSSRRSSGRTSDEAHDRMDGARRLPRDDPPRDLGPVRRPRSVDRDGGRPPAPRGDAPRIARVPGRPLRRGRGGRDSGGRHPGRVPRHLPLRERRPPEVRTEGGVMTDRRALIFETETPSEKPRFHPPRHPRWEKILPAPVRTRHYIPAAEVDLTRLPDGTFEVSATALPSDAAIASGTYPSQETR